jgi:hypothetical protein
LRGRRAAKKACWASETFMVDLVPYGTDNFVHRVPYDFMHNGNYA